MKVLIQGDKIPHTIDCSIAYHGFEELEADIVLLRNWFSMTKEDFEQYDVCVGGVDICRFALMRMQIKYFEIFCYPEKLIQFLGREIYEIQVKDILKIKEEKFVKPVRPKAFATLITNDEDQFVNLMNIDDNEKAYVSDIINFESEWRVYINKNNIEAICNYKGDPTLFPDVDIIKAMIYSWEGPVCYVLDVGVSQKKTLLVEFNDFYSIGNYGLFPEKYAQMLLLRWSEFKCIG
jgi:hypothetical protein